MPAATHTASIPSGTAWATIGSSALATTTTSRAAPSAARQRTALLRTSAIRSIWSRERLRSTTARNGTWAITAGSQRSSISATSRAPSGCGSSRAETTPLGRLAPWMLVATGPRVSSAVAMSRVVVVLPLVPLTATAGMPAAARARASGHTSVATLPPMTAPLPRPSRCEVRCAARPRAAATRRRVSAEGAMSTATLRRVMPARSGR